MVVVKVIDIFRFGMACSSLSTHGMNRFFPYEECEEAAGFYEKARNICNEYLEGKINIDSLVNQLNDVKFGSYLMEIKKVVPKHLQYLWEVSTDDDDEDV